MYARCVLYVCIFKDVSLCMFVVYEFMTCMYGMISVCTLCLEVCMICFVCMLAVCVYNMRVHVCMRVCDILMYVMYVCMLCMYVCYVGTCVRDVFVIFTHGCNVRIYVIMHLVSVWSACRLYMCVCLFL